MGTNNRGFWFRLYNEFAHDPKIQMMPEAMQRRFIMLLCLKNDGTIDSTPIEEIDSVIAFVLRIDEEQVALTKECFLSKGLITEDWDLENWDKRQYKANSNSSSESSSAERVRRYRAKKKKESDVENSSVTPSVTPSVTSSVTENGVTLPRYIVTEEALHGNVTGVTQGVTSGVTPSVTHEQNGRDTGMCISAENPENTGLPGVSEESVTRGVTGSVTPSVTSSVTPYIYTDTETDTDILKEKIYKKESPPVTQEPLHEALQVASDEAPSPQKTREKSEKRATRLPDDFEIPQEWIDWAKQKKPQLTTEQVQTMGEKFINYWTSKGGKEARKVDWKRTWYNWVLSDYNSPAMPAKPKQDFTDPNYYAQGGARMRKDGTYGL